MSILNFCLIWHLSNLWHRWPWLLKTLFSCLLLEVLPCLWSPLSVPAPRLDLTSKIYGAPPKAHASAIPWHLLTSLGERFQMHHFWTSHIQLPIWLFYLETSHASQTESVHTGLRFKHTHTHYSFSIISCLSKWYCYLFSWSSQKPGCHPASLLLFHPTAKHSPSFGAEYFLSLSSSLCLTWQYFPVALCWTTALISWLIDSLPATFTPFQSFLPSTAKVTPENKILTQ